MSYAQQQPPARRLGGVAFVALLHVGIVYALLTGLGRQAIEVLKQPLETKIIQELKAPPPDTAPPPPKLAPPPPPYIPPPEIAIQQAPSANAISAVTNVKPVEAPPPAPVAKAEPVRVAPVIDAARSCRKPEYPSASQRLSEEGTTVLQFLISVDGSVQEGKVVTSSGHPRLDEAAIAALSRCTFKPGTVDGKPEPSWAPLKYTWKLN